MPPQNMPLQPKGYFETEANEKQWMQKAGFLDLLSGSRNC